MELQQTNTTNVNKSRERPQTVGLDVTQRALDVNAAADLGEQQA